jgi:hypothetical protein
MGVFPENMQGKFLFVEKMNPMKAKTGRAPERPSCHVRGVAIMA